MNKLIAVIVLASAFCFAEDIDPIIGKPRSEFTEADKALRKQKIEEFQGGILSVPPAGPKYLVLDTRKAKDSIPGEVAEVFNDVLKIGMDVEKIESGTNDCPRAFALKRLESTNVLAVVMLAENGDKCPALSIFPEERLAVVNVDKLGEGDKKPERICKEIWRATGFVSGASYSPTPKCVMQVVNTLDELDAVNAKGIGVQGINQLSAILKKFGARKGTRMTYRAAVHHGIAPAPTNDLQKAVMKDELERMAKRAKAEEAAKAEEKPADPPAK